MHTVERVGRCRGVNEQHVTTKLTRSSPIEFEVHVYGSKVSRAGRWQRVAIVGVESVIVLDVFDTKYCYVDRRICRLEHHVDRVDVVEGMVLRWINDGLLCMCE